MDCSVSIDSRNYWELCLLFLENLLWVRVCVCSCFEEAVGDSQGCGSGWIGRGTAKRAEKEPWYRKSCRTECVHCAKGPWFTWGNIKGLSWEKMWKSQAGMSQDVWVRRDLVLQGSDLRRKDQMIQHLSVAFCTHSSINTPLHVSLSSCWKFLRRARFTWLSDSKET